MCENDTSLGRVEGMGAGMCGWPGRNSGVALGITLLRFYYATATSRIRLTDNDGLVSPQNLHQM